jgi:hypothetical protein
MKDSQIFHLFCGIHTVLEGTDGQCLAALHFHICALEPDQLTQPRAREFYIRALWGNVSAFFIEKNAFISDL